MTAAVKAYRRVSVKEPETTIKIVSTPEPSAIPEPHISASQIKTYAQCPLQWKLSRVHTPEFVPAALVFGSAIHAAIQQYYQSRLEGTASTLHDLMASYDQKWADEQTGTDGSTPPPIKYTTKAGPEELRQMAEKMLGVFIAHASVNGGEIIAVEEAFTVPMAPGVPDLQGRVDLIEIVKGPSGNRIVNIVDFKTSAKRMKAEDVDREQMDLYSLAMRKNGLLDELRLPLVLRVDVLTKVKEPELTPITITPDPKSEKRVIAKAREISKCMSAGVCYPAPGWQCANCGYKTQCDQWPGE